MKGGKEETGEPHEIATSRLNWKREIKATSWNGEKGHPTGIWYTPRNRRN